MVFPRNITVPLRILRKSKNGLISIVVFQEIIQNAKYRDAIFFLLLIFLKIVYKHIMYL